MNNSKVAICISCYNHEDFLPDLLSSIKNQTYDNWHIFFWDQSESDRCYNIVKKWKDTLKDKITYNRESHSYVYPIGIFRHKMVSLISEYYDYIAIVDADDFWARDKLEKQIEAFKRDNNIKLVFGNCKYEYWNKEWMQQGGFPIWAEEVKLKIDNNKTFHDKYPPLMKGDVFKNLLLKYNFMPCPTLIFEREVLQEVIGNPEAYTSAEDYDWILKIARKYKVGYIPEVLAYYRIHEDQITQLSSIRCTMEEIDVVRKFGKRFLYKKRDRVRLKWRLITLYLKLIYKEIFK